MTNSNITTENKLNEYLINYYGWIPSYRDFDIDDITILAFTEDEAWAEFNRTVKFVKSAGISRINGIKYEHTNS